MVVEGSRFGFLPQRVFVHDPVDLLGGHAGPDEIAHVEERLSRDAARPAQCVYLLG